METKNPRQTKERMIHVRLPEAMHKKVRIRAAEADETIQEWVLDAIKHKLGLDKDLKSDKEQGGR